MKKCPECNSEKIIREARTSATDSSELKIAVSEQPHALIMKKTSYSDVTTQICGDCGYLQFFAKDQRRLWTAYQNQRNNI